MKNFVRRVLKTFKRWGDSLLLAFGDKVTTAMTKEVKTFANPVPAIADIVVELDIFRALIKDAPSSGGCLHPTFSLYTTSRYLFCPGRVPVIISNSEINFTEALVN